MAASTHRERAMPPNNDTIQFYFVQHASGSSLLHAPTGQSLIANFGPDEYLSVFIVEQNCFESTR